MGCPTNSRLLKWPNCFSIFPKMGYLELMSCPLDCPKRNKLFKMENANPISSSVGTTHEGDPFPTPKDLADCHRTALPKWPSEFDLMANSCCQAFLKPCETYQTRKGDAVGGAGGLSGWFLPTRLKHRGSPKLLQGNLHCEPEPSRRAGSTGTLQLLHAYASEHDSELRNSSPFHAFEVQVHKKYTPSSHSGKGRTEREPLFSTCMLSLLPKKAAHAMSLSAF